MLPLYAFMDKQEKHSIPRRSPGNNYTHPGIYHITITISDRKAQSLGRVTGDLQYPDGHPDAPGLYHHARTHALYSQFKNSIISKNGRMTHLGQIIAGFKKGCNHRYWEIIGQGEVAAKPLPTPSPPSIVL